jgi:hypothetical protein
MIDINSLFSIRILLEHRSALWHQIERLRLFAMRIACRRIVLDLTVADLQPIVNRHLEFVGLCELLNYHGLHLFVRLEEPLTEAHLHVLTLCPAALGFLIQEPQLTSLTSRLQNMGCSVILEPSTPPSFQPNRALPTLEASLPSY